MKIRDCFGLYGGTVVCNRCQAAKRCKAVLISDGFDIMGSFVENLVETLPNLQFRDANGVNVMVDQLMDPGAWTPQKDDLLNILEIQGISSQPMPEGKSSQ